MNAEQLATLVKTVLEDIKAQNIVILDVGGMTSIADRIVVASGTSSRHVKSIADRVIERVKEAGVRPLGIEGDAQTDWVLVDIGDVIVHVMTPATRQYYDLERLWSIGPRAAADKLGGDRIGGDNAAAEDSAAEANPAKAAIARASAAKPRAARAGTGVKPRSKKP